MSSFDGWAKAGAIFDLYLADRYRLGQFAGEYYSEELQSTCNFAPCAGDLFVRRGREQRRLATMGTD